MIVILFLVIALVAWSLHLMQEAIEHQEFSMMLAGLLVASAAAAMVSVYFLMGNYIGYVTQIPQRSYTADYSTQSLTWIVQSDERLPEWASLPIEAQTLATESLIK